MACRSGKGEQASVHSSDTRELTHSESAHKYCFSQTDTALKTNTFTVPQCLHPILPTLAPGFLNDWQVRYLKQTAI